jgi:ribosome biogenesis GTPase / thiamine phosphate phosphatase
MKALVYKSTGSWYNVKDETGKWHNARIKGVFKIDDITSTNPLAVGDEVTIELENEKENTAMIVDIGVRRNYINRQSPRSKYQHHIVAANLDQSLLVATLRDPKTSQGFLDRFLVAAEMYHVKPLIVFNKADIYRAKEQEQFTRFQEMYSAIGYQVFLTSTKEKMGIDALRDALHSKTSLISGHSGVGKSTLLNAILPDLGLKTQEVSNWSGKGMHTTTFAEMFDLPEGGRIIDTPGMREFGLVDITRDRLTGCQFNNCLHINEPGCAIKKAVEDGIITEERYISYAVILESIDDKGY